MNDIDTKILERVEELRRSANTDSIEAASLMLKKGKSKTFNVDTQIYQRIRTRFNNLKKQYGLSFETTLKGNRLEVVRLN